MIWPLWGNGHWLYLKVLYTPISVKSQSKGTETLHPKANITAAWWQLYAVIGDRELKLFGTSPPFCVTNRARVNHAYLESRPREVRWLAHGQEMAETGLEWRSHNSWKCLPSLSSSTWNQPTVWFRTSGSAALRRYTGQDPACWQCLASVTLTN